MPHCRYCEVQLATLAWNFARLNAGSSSAAKMAMMAMTTSSSINVKPDRRPAVVLSTFIIRISAFVVSIVSISVKALRPGSRVRKAKRSKPITLTVQAHIVDWH